MARDISPNRGQATVEWLKAELVSGTADLFRSTLRRHSDLMLDSLSQIVFCSFLLARRLGFSFQDLDEKVERRVRSHLEVGHEMERWHGDLSAYLGHLNEHRKERSHVQPPGATGSIL